MADSWTPIVNQFIGFILGRITAFSYDWIIKRIKKNQLLKKYAFLQSSENKFDWQTWKITGGKIDEKPIESFTTLQYKDKISFRYKWKECGEVLGEGIIIWEDSPHGKLSFYEFEKRWFDYRNVYYKLIKHQG